MICILCGSKRIAKKGIRRKQQRYKCKECKRWFSVPLDTSVIDTVKNNSDVRIAVVDIEVLPAIGFFFEIYNTNISPDNIIKDICLLSWAGKFLNEPEVYSDILTSNEVIERDTKRITKSLWEFLNKCDIVIGHNFLGFDQKQINTAFLMHGLLPLDYRVIDTYLTAKNVFKFTSNKMKFINRKLNIKQKVENEGMPLWINCSDGIQDSLDIMLEYNEGDCYATEDLYYTLRPYIKNHPNLSLYGEVEGGVCPVCKSDALVEKGQKFLSSSVYTAYRCESCGAISRDKYNLLSKDKRKSFLTGV